MKKTRLVLPFLAIAPLLVSGLVGCGPTSTSSATSQEEQGLEASATNVLFNSEGKYTTTLSGQNFSGVVKDDVIVNYFNGKEVVNTSITACEEKEKDLSVSFVDPAPYSNESENYSLAIPSKNIYSVIKIDSAERFFKVDVAELSSFDKEHTVNLTLNEGEFVSGVKKEQIDLEGSAKNLSIKTINNTPTKLSLVLEGELVKLEDVGIYEDAKINIAPAAVKDTRIAPCATIGVSDREILFNAKTLKEDHGEYTIDLILNGLVDTETLKASDIKFAKDVNVTKLTKVEDKVNVSLNVVGAKNINEAANILNGQIVKVKELYTKCNVSNADFYPKFEYIENSGDNFLLGLNLFAQNGEFNSKVNKSAFTFGNEIKDAEIKNFKLVNKTTIDMVLSVPKNGQTLEQFSYDGDITIAKGSLINVWGGEADAYVATRNYGNTSIGKNAILSGITGFLSGPFSQLGGVALGVGVAASALQTLLEVTGVVESQEAKIERQFKETQDMINKAKDELVGMLNKQNEVLDKIKNEIEQTLYQTYISSMTSYKKVVNDLLWWSSVLDNYYLLALDQMSYSIPEMDSDAAEWNSSQNDLLKHIQNQLKNEETHSKFAGYPAAVQKLKELYLEVVSYIQLDKLNNPFDTLDLLCSKVYNFDTQSYEERATLRGLTLQALSRGLSHILLADNYTGGDIECKAFRDAFTLSVRHLEDTNTLNFDYWTKYDRMYMYHTGMIFNNKKAAYDVKYLYGSQQHICSGAMFGLAEPPYNKYTAAIKEFALDSKQLEEFKHRMHGRSWRQELELAHVPSEYVGYGIGVAVDSKIYDSGYSVFMQYKEKHTVNLYVENWDSGERNYLQEFNYYFVRKEQPQGSSNIVYDIASNEYHNAFTLMLHEDYTRPILKAKGLM